MGNIIQTKIMGKVWLVRAILLLIIGLLPLLSVAQEEINPFAGGEGSAENPYQIENWEQLNEVRNYLDSNFILINNLDQNSTGYDNLASSTANEGQGWEPIGDADNEFTGVFDGNHYSIHDLYINQTTISVSEGIGMPQAVGLFGLVYSEGFGIDEGVPGKTSAPEEITTGVIKNLSIVDADISGIVFVGAIAGLNEGVLVNVSVSGNVRGKLLTGGISGGSSGFIIQATSTADVMFNTVALEDNEEISFFEIGGMGGITGLNIGGIALSSSSGNIGFTQEIIDVLENSDGDIGFGFFPVGYGGLVGINTSEFIGVVTTSYSSANVFGLFGTGGLIGFNGFDLLQPKSTSSFYLFDQRTSAELENIPSYFDGLDPLEVVNTYATGDVQGLFGTGGLIGGNSGHVTNSYSVGSVEIWPEFFEEIGNDQPTKQKTDEEPFYYEEFALGGLIGASESMPLVIKSGPNFSITGFSGADLRNIISQVQNKQFSVEEDPAEYNVFGSFWDTQTSGIPVSAGGTGLNTREMKTIFTYLNASWDFNNLWAIEEGYSGPSLPFKGNGVYVSYPYFGNNQDAPLQDPLPGLSELGTERVLAGSAMETVIDITDLDFGTGESITVTQVPPEFIGVLKLDGNNVSIDDEIQKTDVEDGNLVFESGFDNRYENSYVSDTFLSFQYENTDRTVNLFIDNAARSIWHDEPEGWYLFASPSIDQTVGDLLDGIRTDGFSGSTNPGASFPTVYVLNQEQYRWEAVNNINQELDQGQALLVYVFQEDLDELDENNPELLASDGPWLPLDGSFSFDIWYDSDQGPQGNSHFLIANPHPIDINICSSLLRSDRVANNYYIWSPSENDGNGGYINFLCDLVFEGQEFGSPISGRPLRSLEGFWIRTTDENPLLDIREEDYGFEMRLIEPDPQKENVKLRPLSLKLEHNNRNYSGSAHILFSSHGSDDLDNYDAMHLSSAGLAERYLSVFAIDEENRKYNLQSLPYLTQDEHVIPLGIETTEAGNYTFSWALPSDTPAGVSYYLRDTKSESLTELENGGRYSFSLSESEVTSVEKSLNGERSINAKEVTFTTNRFELIATMKDLRTDIELPADIALKQNYPNPFNPTTVIEYQLPQSAQVRLQVYDMAGRQVAELVNDQVSPGTHTINFDASNLSSGVYMYRLQAGTKILTRKLTLVK